MSVELWLVRHGETEWSLSGQHTSTSEIPLTDHGRKRAEELRDYLAGRPFAAVFVSPRQRARETCAIAGYGDVAQVEDGLVEWNYGEAEGKTTPQMREVYGPEWSVWSSVLKGGETVDAVGARVDAVIARALAATTHADPPTSSKDDNKKDDGAQRVLMFAHAHVLRILAARWLTLPAVDGKMLALGTGSLSVLGFERETRVIEWWNRGFEEA
jgi:broad specificity phosphatase PhoE